MIIATWIIFLFFGLMALNIFKNYLFNSIRPIELYFMAISVIIAAICAGILFGGIVIAL